MEQQAAGRLFPVTSWLTAHANPFASACDRMAVDVSKSRSTGLRRRRKEPNCHGARELPLLRYRQPPSGAVRWFHCWQKSPSGWHPGSTPEGISGYFRSKRGADQPRSKDRGDGSGRRGRSSRAGINQFQHFVDHLDGKFRNDAVAAVKHGQHTAFIFGLKVSIRELQVPPIPQYYFDKPCFRIHTHPKPIA